MVQVADSLKVASTDNKLWTGMKSHEANGPRLYKIFHDADLDHNYEISEDEIAEYDRKLLLEAEENSNSKSKPKLYSSDKKIWLGMKDKNIPVYDSRMHYEFYTSDKDNNGVIDEYEILKYNQKTIGKTIDKIQLNRDTWNWSGPLYATFAYFAGLNFKNESIKNSKLNKVLSIVSFTASALIVASVIFSNIYAHNKIKETYENADEEQFYKKLDNLNELS